MPGPPLQKQFTYNGTPTPLYRSEPFNRLDRCMIQAQRFWNSPDTGTHARNFTRKNIPKNSDLGIGAASGGLTNVDSDNTI
jgi:hypothetical protein